MKHESSQAMQVLDAAPVAVVLFDEQGKAVWGNQALQDFLGVAFDRLAGRTFAELLSGHTEPGAEGLYRVPAGEGRAERWLQVTPPADLESGQVSYLLDVTEQRRMAVQLAQQEVADALTGLLNDRALMRELSTQVSRSRRYGNPLSLVKIEITGFDSAKPGVVKDQVLLAIGQFLRDQLRWVDQVGRDGEDSFTLVLPETGQADAATIAAKIQQRLEALDLPENGGSPVAVAARIGVAEWQKGDDLHRLLRRVQEAM